MTDQTIKWGIHDESNWRMVSKDRKDLSKMRELGMMGQLERDSAVGERMGRTLTVKRFLESGRVLGM